MRIFTLSLLLAGAIQTLSASAPVPGQTPAGVAPQAGEMPTECSKSGPTGHDSNAPTAPKAQVPVPAPRQAAPKALAEPQHVSTAKVVARQPHLAESASAPVDGTAIPWGMVALSSVVLSLGTLWLLGPRRKLVARR